jgi:hypothetical protein
MFARVGIVLSGVALLLSACNQTPNPAALRIEIEPLVKKLAQMRQKDISGAAAMYSSVLSLIAASNGEIDRGMDAVRASLDNALKQGDSYEIALGSIDVVGRTRIVRGAVLRESHKPIRYQSGLKRSEFSCVA